jgi:hypothetical protein
VDAEGAEVLEVRLRHETDDAEPQRSDCRAPLELGVRGVRAEHSSEVHVSSLAPRVRPVKHDRSVPISPQRGSLCVAFPEHNESRYARLVSIPDERAASLRQKSSVSFVFVVSLGMIVASAVRAWFIVAGMVDHLAHRTTGIEWTWTTERPIHQPAGAGSGGAEVVPGTAAAVTEMTGRVQDLPVATIVLHSASDLVAVLTAAGIAVCLLLVTRSIGDGRPFARTCSRALVTLAVIVFVGFEASAILELVSQMTQPEIATALPESTGTYVGHSEQLGAPFWPLVAAAGLAALAAVFRTAEGYRADASGLV